MSTKPPIPPVPPVGAVDFGDFRRVAPFSYEWGFERGRPIDRVYIDAFFARHADDINGHVVSIGDDGYARRFGGARVSKSDVLDVRGENAQATIVADLADAPDVPSGGFDCVICPQTLQFTFDVRGAVRTICRVLKPGGVALVTIPGVSQTYDPGEDGAWSWHFTPHSAHRLFGEVFGDRDVETSSHGNALTAVSFLMGLAEQDLNEADFGHHEPGYEIVMTVRAVKR